MTDAEIAARLAYLGFTEEDRARLERLGEKLAEHAPAFARAFYDSLLRYPELARLVPDAVTRDRLEATQATYFRRLFSGRYDRDYVLDRLRVGLAHDRVGLAPQWYLGAYSRYLADLLPNIEAALADTPGELLPTLAALARIALFDMALAMETYIAARERALADTQDALLRAQAVAHIGCWWLDFASGTLEWSPEVFRIFGLRQEDYEEKPLDYATFLARVHPDDRERVDAAWQAALRGAAYRLEHRIVVDGAVRWVEERAAIDFDTEGRPVGRAVGTVQDITERKAAQARIEQLAYYDSLTGLANRAQFHDILARELAATSRRGNSLALLYFDLDHFKEVNDTLGHAAGDQLLAQVAHRLRAVLRQEELLARLSGDEFAVLIHGGEQEAAAVCERLLAVLVAPFEIEGREFRLGASIGIACAPQDASDAQDLLRCADIAMYEAKDRRRAFRFYRPHMAQNLTRRMDIARRLEAALNEHRLALHVQPIVELATGRLAGAEVLLRWHEPDWGDVSPALFVAVAEERGLVEPLGEWVFGHACAPVKSWLDAGTPLPGRLAIDVSPRQFENGNLVHRFEQLARRAQVSPQHLELELTESAVMQDPERAVRLTHELAEAGFHLALDDFGTGYSSLAHSTRFRLHRLKIDLSFVRQMLENRHHHAVVSTIVAMGEHLGVETLAEGIEQPAQAEALTVLGCRYGQGYFFGRPQPPAEFAARWLRAPRE